MLEVNNIKYKISEIFYSIQGEGVRSGMPCVFVRLQGCKLNCSWCDTQYALDFKGGTEMTGEEIIKRVNSFACTFVEFTGGEPLHNNNILPLMAYFCDNDYTVAVETGGYESIEHVDRRVTKILDVKCPGSNMSKHNNYDNFKFLNQEDEVKFVISDRTDYEWAKDIIFSYSLHERTSSILLSPAFNLIEPFELAKWILHDKLSVRLQLQVHKYIWDPGERGV